MSAVAPHNPILDECNRATNKGGGDRVDRLASLSARGALATRALEIVSKAPEAETYVELLRKLDML